MKTRFLIIIGAVLIISVAISFSNYYISEREYESRNTPDQLKAILVSCACESKINTYPEPDELCIGRVGSWQNSTHYIDNNLCEFITLEEHNGAEEQD